MIKNDFIIPAVFGLILVAIYLASLDWISPPSVTVKYYGKPVANTSVMFMNTSQQDALTDANGRVYLSNRGDHNASIHVSLPDGTGTFLRFPRYGNWTVDFQGPKTITRSEVSYFGIFTSTEEGTTYSYTDEQADAIDTKQMTIEDAQKLIDQEIEKRLDSEN
ncbi:hypothetical protein Pan97_45970 [Bremerella volcania]|uniref:Uncharacterized protein n=1 Tax=Bremerella volcania TaxID=2527984 RepID=A0A518CE79_9BACT|nr:DUF4198 domain-containing protein [Bremerella volcania]QDU77526.1 hypothetical protein Pan97_45970 [Bremerella volcania]